MVISEKTIKWRWNFRTSEIRVKAKRSRKMMQCSWKSDNVATQNEHHKESSPHFNPLSICIYGLDSVYSTRYDSCRAKWFQTLETSEHNRREEIKKTHNFIRIWRIEIIGKRVVDESSVPLYLRLFVLRPPTRARACFFLSSHQHICDTNFPSRTHRATERGKSSWEWYWFFPVDFFTPFESERKVSVLKIFCLHAMFSPQLGLCGILRNCVVRDFLSEKFRLLSITHSKDISWWRCYYRVEAFDAAVHGIDAA